jgi:putative nucleotidyltransferase-like protein
VLDRAGIGYRALKGPALAHLAYPDPALRSFGDVDVLVAGPAFDAAVRALTGLRFARHFTEPRPRFDARFAKGACLERCDGTEIDLHRTLAPGAFGIRLGRLDLFARPGRTFALGTHAISGLDAETAFVHACFHAALGDHPPRLVPLRDIVQLHGQLDPNTVLAMFTAVSCETVCRRALALVEEELGIRLEGAIPSWARAYQPNRFDRWALQGYASDDRSYAGQVAASICAVPSLRDRLAYGAALAFPSREYVRAHDGGYVRRIARGLRIMKDSRPR